MGHVHLAGADGYGFDRRRPGEANLQVFLLGRFEVLSNGSSLQLANDAARLVAYLALRSRPQSRLSVSAALWPDTAQDRASARLRAALWKVRRVERALLVADGCHLKLDHRVAVDAHDLSTPVPLAHGTTSELWRVDDLLPDWDEDWLPLERERVRQLRLHRLEEWGIRLMESGQYRSATEVLQAAVAAEPLRESARRLLIAAHVEAGNVAEAVRQYDEFAGLLRKELGVCPTSAMQELVRKLVDARPGRG
jgi:DNA-binding SARP family transcriptional activator